MRVAGSILDKFDVLTLVIRSLFVARSLLLRSVNFCNIADIPEC